jgi:serine/threonine protein kinase
MRINHKNCLKINWFGDFNNHYVFVSDNCEKKDLNTFINNLYKFESGLDSNNSNYKEGRQKYLSESVMKYITHQMISLLECFESIRLVHGNLSPSNILLTKDLQIKVTDFACSRFLYGNEVFKLRKNEHEVDITSQPPEYFRMSNVVELKDANKIDIFSFGCCLYFMATGENLFKDLENVNFNLLNIFY